MSDGRRVDDEHLDAEREQHDADVERQRLQQVPAEDRRQVEHEAGDGDRREADDEADQLHRHLEQPSIPRCSALVVGVFTSSRPMPKIRAKNITEDVVVGHRLEHVVGDDREHGADALTACLLAEMIEPAFSRPFSSMARPGPVDPAPGSNRLATASASSTAMLERSTV
jgi:hypothetical protein